MASKISRFGYFSGRPPRLGGGDQMLNQRPFTVTEVGWVWFAGFHAPDGNLAVLPGASFLNTL